MRVTVDLDACEGNGKCVQAAPEVFELPADEDQVQVKVDPIPAELEGAVDRAVRVCPRQALQTQS